MSLPLSHDDPQKIGPFELISRLGSGGMGTVYVARSPRGRMVAIKTMQADYAANDEFRTRFHLECDAARVIGGEYGAAVVNADPLAEIPWLATEYVLGMALDEAVEVSGPLPENATRCLGVALCYALTQLHASDVVHRDLKPSNILITATGPKIIDFGIARAVGDDRLTRTGTAAGTPAFMSPEQAVGEEHGPRGDTFSLAGVLVHACTGRGPFGSGQPADLLYRVRYAEADLTAVPTSLQALLGECLSKDPQQRPDLWNLANALKGHLVEGFAEYLPHELHAELSRRGAAAWDVPPIRLSPERTPVGISEKESGGARGIWTRRRLITAAGSGVLVSAATAGLWTYVNDNRERREDGNEQGSDVAPKPNWSRKIVTAGSSMFLTEKYIALASNQGLTTVNAESGKVSVTNRAATSRGSIQESDGQLYGENGRQRAVSSFNLGTATFEKSIVTYDEIGMSGLRIIAASDGMLLLEGSTKKLYEGKRKRQRICVDASSGAVRWRKDRESLHAEAREYEVGKVATGEGIVVFHSSFDERVWAIDLESGKEIWVRRFPGAGALNPRISGVYEGYIYVGSQEIHAVRMSDGASVWRFGQKRRRRKKHRAEGEIYGPPAYKDGVLYGLTPGNSIIALDADTGKLIWEEEASWVGAVPFLAVPVVGEKYIYFPSDKSRWVTAVDIERREKVWTLLGDNDNILPNIGVHRESQQLIVTADETVMALPLR